MTDNTAIVLVGPQGEANIGTTARAMKNFGFSDLRLVSPCTTIGLEAKNWAVDARDLVENAKTFDSLDSALADIACAAAFTRRLGRSRRRHLVLDEAAALLAKRAARGGIALVFGREDAGLSNDEIARCDIVVEIPSSKAFPSLNLGQAAMLACYECSQARNISREDAGEGNTAEDFREERFLSREAIAQTLARVDAMLAALEYDNDTEKQLRARIFERFEKLFGRAGLTARDAAMFEGLCTRMISKATREA